MDKDILKVLDIQKFLDISRSKAYQIVNSSGFPIIRLGNSIRIEKKEFLTWLDTQKNTI